MPPRLPPLTLSLALLMALASACAIPGPPYLPKDPPPDPARFPVVTLTEGQPRGALLEIRLPEDEGRREATERLVLLRKALTSDTTDFEAHFTFDRQEPSPLWEAGRVNFLDAGLKPDVTYLYAVAIKAEGDTIYGRKLLEVVWETPPEPPELVEAESIGNHMLLRWKSGEGLGAVIFRRELGKKRFVRLEVPGPLGEGLFVDESIRPGAVYAYRVSTVRYRAGISMIGLPSPEIYVAAMREGPIFPRDRPENDAEQDPR